MPLALASESRAIRRPKQVVLYGHPLTGGRPRGTVLSHRLILFESLGGAGGPCHVCGRLLSWMTKGRDELVVDHLDGDWRNNQLSNLAPACRGCNANREDGTGYLTDVVLHGSARRYRRGCRCNSCRDSMRYYWQAWRLAHVDECRQRNRRYAREHRVQINRVRSRNGPGCHE